MLPIRTERSNFIFRSSTSDVPDMPGERIQPGHVRSVWELTVHERDAIMDGLNIELHILAEPIPPVWLGVTYEAATLVMRRRGLVADRFLGDDGRWYVRMVSENGTELGLSKGYKDKWSAWLAQRCLRRVLPGLEVRPQ